MTDHLQVMDLVVNGPLKAAFRETRAANLFLYFQNWKFDRSSKGHQVPFTPPSPKLSEGIATLMGTVIHKFCTEDFKAGLQRSFVSVGLAPDLSTSAHQFRKYQGHPIPVHSHAFKQDDASNFHFGDMIGALETMHRETVDDLASAVDELDLGIDMEDDVEEFEGYD